MHYLPGMLCAKRPLMSKVSCVAAVWHRRCTFAVTVQPSRGAPGRPCFSTTRSRSVKDVTVLGSKIPRQGPTSFKGLMRSRSACCYEMTELLRRYYIECKHPCLTAVMLWLNCCIILDFTVYDGIKGFCKNFHGISIKNGDVSVLSNLNTSQPVCHLQDGGCVNGHCLIALHKRKACLNRQPYTQGQGLD